MWQVGRPKKEPPRILAGLLTYDSGWNPSFGDPFKEAIGALAAFLIRLLARLQALGTVPAIDYDDYGRMLEIENTVRRLHCARSDPQRST